MLRRLRVRSERHGQLLLLFGRHRLQHVPLTAGDRELFEAYGDALRARNLLDYDGLVASTGELLRTHPDVRADVRSRWDYVLVDEFQDLSLAQYEVVDRAGRGATGTASPWATTSSRSSPGPAPTPPSWSASATTSASPTPIILDLNRRCSRQIFEAARRLVTHNPGLFEKRLEATRESEHCVAAYAFADESCEAEWVVRDLLRDRRGHVPRLGRLRGAVPLPPDRPAARDPLHRGRHPLPHGRAARRCSTTS